MPFRELHEQVDVAVRPILAASHASEDAEHPHAVALCEFQDIAASTTQPASDRPGEPLHALPGLTQGNVELVPGRSDQRSERGERGLAMARFGDADHALCHAVRC